MQYGWFVHDIQLANSFKDFFYKRILSFKIYEMQDEIAFNTLL